MQWRVGLEAYEVVAAHGWYEEERQHPQPFIFTVWATLTGNDRIEDLDEMTPRLLHFGMGLQEADSWRVIVEAVQGCCDS